MDTAVGVPVAGFVPLTLSDWPGHIAAVVFIRGCNMHCPWCHNPSLVYPACYAPLIPDDEVVRFIDSLSPLLYDGVVVTGGEPLAHPGLPLFLKLIKNRGLKVRLDTNGSYPDRLSSLMREGLVDEVAVDYKVPLERYCELGPVRSSDIARTFKLVAETGRGYLRTTVVPGLHSDEVLETMRRELIDTTRTPVRWIMQEYQPPPEVNSRAVS